MEYRTPSHRVPHTEVIPHMSNCLSPLNILSGMPRDIVNASFYIIINSHTVSGFDSVQLTSVRRKIFCIFVHIWLRILQWCNRTHTLIYTIRAMAQFNSIQKFARAYLKISRLIESIFASGVSFVNPNVLCLSAWNSLPRCSMTSDPWFQWWCFEAQRESALLHSLRSAGTPMCPSAYYWTPASALPTTTQYVIFNPLTTVAISKLLRMIGRSVIYPRELDRDWFLLGHRPDCRLGWSSEYVKKLIHACHDVSVACRPVETRRRRTTLGQFRGQFSRDK